MKRPYPFILMHGGHPPSEEYTLKLSTPPMYHFAYCCTKCAEIWCRHVWLWPPRFNQFWFIPALCPEHGGTGYIGTRANHYRFLSLLDQFRGADLRREFLHLTNDLGDLYVN